MVCFSLGKLVGMKLQDAMTQGVVPWEQHQIVRSDDYISVFRDGFPVADGHLLFVPNLNSDVMIQECFADALHTGRQMIAAGECQGFNIGINMGASAGQTVMWPHVHLIPRRTGDVADPRGGVRHVIPDRANYLAK
jgi:diadenosine tetraphosphate (Ap4A) HIT family hydrolase